MINEWKEHVIDALLSAGIYRKNHDNDPAQALHDLIVWETKVALDPAVSEPARKLAGMVEQPFQIVSFQINPVNGTIVALCANGSMWIRSGVETAHAAPWKPLPKPAAKPQEESEDEITTLV